VRPLTSIIPNLQTLQTTFDRTLPSLIELAPITPRQVMQSLASRPLLPEEHTDVFRVNYPRIIPDWQPLLGPSCLGHIAGPRGRGLRQTSGRRSGAPTASELPMRMPRPWPALRGLLVKGCRGCAIPLALGTRACPGGERPVEARAWDSGQHRGEAGMAR